MAHTTVCAISNSGARHHQRRRQQRQEDQRTIVGSNRFIGATEELIYDGERPIARTLNAEGVPTQFGRQWKPATVWNVVRRHFPSMV